MTVLQYISRIIEWVALLLWGAIIACGAQTIETPSLVTSDSIATVIPSQTASTETVGQALGVDSLVAQEGVPLSLSLNAPLETEAATQTDSTASPAATIATTEEPVPPKLPFWKQPYPNSTVALLCSIVPGGGQLYNQRYWKMPIVWGAMAGATFFIVRNQRIFGEYFRAYADLMGPDPMSKDSWKVFVPYGADPEEYLKNGSLKGTLDRGVKESKANRDLSLLIGGVLYMLSALDAYVDSELYYFDVSPNLSIRIGPTITPPSPGTPPSAGVGISGKF